MIYNYHAVIWFDNSRFWNIFFNDFEFSSVSKMDFFGFMEKVNDELQDYLLNYLNKNKILPKEKAFDLNRVERCQIPIQIKVEFSTLHKINILNIYVEKKQIIYKRRSKK